MHLMKRRRYRTGPASAFEHYVVTGLTGGVLILLIILERNVSRLDKDRGRVGDRGRDEEQRKGGSRTE